jgi:3-hydroxyacyl-[acyl-carrier-protein] dehydratase
MLAAATAAALSMASTPRSAAAVTRAVARLTGHSPRVLITSVVTAGAPARGATAVLVVRRERMPELRGHFPGRPVLPAVMLLEALFQAAACCTAGGGAVDVRAVESARFRRPVGDGEDVVLRVAALGGGGRCEGVGQVLSFQGTAVLRGEGDDGKDVPVAEALFECVVSPPAPHHVCAQGQALHCL